MQVIRHLLCPVDLSAPSALALRHAAALTSMMNAELTILHVRAPGRPSGPGNTSDMSLEMFALDILGSVTATRLMERQGEPVAQILSAAVDTAPDVIVLGTRGLSGLRRLLLGSVADRVIRQSSIPVLAVPPASKMHSIALETVLCAVDFSSASQRAVDYAASIAAAAQARLVLAHVLEWSEETDALPSSGRRSLPSSEEDATARLNELVTNDIRMRCAPELAVGYGEPADEILRFVQERRVDMIVLGIRRRNPLDLAVFGSTTQRLIRDGACAVLTVGPLENT